MLNNVILHSNDLFIRALSVEDTSVVSGWGPSLVVCSRKGLGEQLLHVEGTLTVISRTEATSIKPLSPSNPTFTLRVIHVVQPLRSNLFYQNIYSSTVLKYHFMVLVKMNIQYMYVVELCFFFFPLRLIILQPLKMIL